MCGAYHCSSILRIFDRDRPDTSPGRVPVSMPVAPNDTLRWSDAGNTLRFTVLNPSKGGSSIWEMRGLHGRPEPLSGYPADSRNGTWSADGRLFVFLAKGQAGYDGHDIWVADERNGQKPARPFRLTSGPLDSQWAAPSPDGRRVYAIGSLFAARRVHGTTDNRFDGSTGSKGTRATKTPLCAEVLARRIHGKRRERRKIVGY